MTRSKKLSHLEGEEGEAQVGLASLPVIQICARLFYCVVIKSILVQMNNRKEKA